MHATKIERKKSFHFINKSAEHENEARQSTEKPVAWELYCYQLWLLPMRTASRAASSVLCLYLFLLLFSCKAMFTALHHTAECFCGAASVFSISLNVSFSSIFRSFFLSLSKLKFGRLRKEMKRNYRFEWNENTKFRNGMAIENSWRATEMEKQDRMRPTDPYALNRCCCDAK